MKAVRPMRTARRSLAGAVILTLLALTPPAGAQTNSGPKDGRVAPPPAIASVEGGVEAAIDAPWRLEPDLGGPVRYPVIPIVVSVHDANLQTDPETAQPLGQFCELAIREDNGFYGPPATTQFRLAASVDEIERSDGWPPNSDVAANQRRCRPASGQVCPNDLNVGTSGEWNATVLYVPQNQTAGADIHLEVQARFSRANVPCSSPPKPIAADFPPFDRLATYPYPPDPYSYIIVNRLNVHLGEEPLPRFAGGGWAYGDLHYHAQGTDNEGESAYANRPTLQAMRAIGLDFVFATDHASDSIQTTDIDIIYLRNIDVPDWLPGDGYLEDLIESIPIGLLTAAYSARDMSPQRFATLLGQLNDPDGANAELMQSPGRRGAARLFLGGEVDVIPEMSPAERQSGTINFGNRRAYNWRAACTGEGFLAMDLIRDHATADLCDNAYKLAVLASEGGRYLVKDLQGLSDSYFARQHMIHLPVDGTRYDAFVSSGTSLFGGATRRLGPAVPPPDQQAIAQNVLWRDYAVENKGYAFLAHPVAFDRGRGIGRLGPDIVPYSDLQLKTAFASPFVLGLQLWNEDTRMRSSQSYSFGSPGFPMQQLDGASPAASRFLWYWWQGLSPAGNMAWPYGSLHHGMVAWDKMLMWGLRPSQTSGLGWVPAGQPRRVFMAGGSDAHGDWNYRREGSIGGMSAATDTAIGKPRNLVYVGPERPETVTDPSGTAFGTVGQEQVTSALASGTFAITDGPALRIVLDANSNFVLDDADVPMGGVSLAPSRGAYVPFFVEWKSTAEFGPIENIDLYVGVANDQRDVAVVYAPVDHGVHSSETPRGAVTSHPLIDAQGGVHPELMDGYLLDPVGTLRIVPTSGQAMEGRRRVLLRANDFPTGRRRVIEPQDPVCHFYPPQCHPAEDLDCNEVCTDPVPGEWHFDALSVPDRWYVRAFARTAEPAGALCADAIETQESLIAKRSGRCIERLAFTNPIWVDNTVVPPPPPDFSIACVPADLTIPNQSSRTSTCTVRSLNGFASAVSLSCFGLLPQAAGCSFSPATVTPPANGAVTSTLTVSVGQASAGTATIQPQGRASLLSHQTSVVLHLTGAVPTPAPGTPAVFDATRGAPICNARTGAPSSCDTGTDLVRGRALGGGELHTPNTLGGTCADGPTAAAAGWNANDRIKVSTADGAAFAPGKTVRVEAVVTVPGTPADYVADFYQAGDAANPSWTLIGSVGPTATGVQVLTRTYTLGSGALQAVRVQLRLRGTSGPCAAGSQNDRDDLAFAVGP